MIIGSVSENKNLEKRVAITPDILKKYKSLGIDIHLCKDYASHIGIKDEEYKSQGAIISDSDEEVISNSNALLQMNIINDKNLTDEEKEAAKKKLEEIEKKGEEIAEMLAAIKLKYDEDEFTAALFEKCEAAQKLKEMGEAFEDLGDL